MLTEKYEPVLQIAQQHVTDLNVQDIGGRLRLTGTVSSEADKDLLWEAVGRIDPERTGELVRAYVLGRRYSVSKTAALASIAVERLFDGITMLAFILGAATVVSSLRSVDDRTAAAWMARFYDARFRRRARVDEAVREANLASLDERVAMGLSTHPYYWSGFIATGEWR